ncbi:MAG: hypothetical protein P4L98_19155 [Ancalomicrobiaceae bacterium]|nr:hypothetical protein [Ancalomicrobiaceae bacterium]
MDPATLLSRRRKVSAGYTAAGFVAAATLLLAGSGTLADKIPIWLALAFTGIIIVSAWIGGVVALDLKSGETPWAPLQHGPAIVRSAPLGLFAVAVTLAVSWLMLWSGTETVIYLPAVGFALWVRWRVGQAAA